MPRFLHMLGNVSGLKGLDIGCGEGHNTRTIARQGSDVTGLDISDTFLEYARQEENDRPAGIAYVNASGSCVPFKDNQSDFCIAVMSLMDMPRMEEAIAETYRVLKPGGFFNFQ